MCNKSEISRKENMFSIHENIISKGHIFKQVVVIRYLEMEYCETKKYKHIG
jgi:hypothetical protein